MKKNLIFSSLLLSNFLYTGCVQRDTLHPEGSYQNTPIQTTQTSTIESRPTYQSRNQYEYEAPQVVEVVEESYPQNGSNYNYQEEYYEEEVINAPQTTLSYENSTTPIEYYQEESVPVSNSNITYQYENSSPTQAYYPTETQSTPQYQNPTSPAPITKGVGANFKSIQGDNIRIAKNPTGLTFPQYQGKIVLLEIFGKNCHYCFEEMPIINQMRAKYGNSLQVIAIQGQDPMSSATSTRLIQKYNMHYPIIERDVANDLLVFISETYGWMGVLPYIQLIKNGVTEFNFGDGGVSAQELSESIDSLL